MDLTRTQCRWCAMYIGPFPFHVESDVYYHRKCWRKTPGEIKLSERYFWQRWRYRHGPEAEPPPLPLVQSASGPYRVV